MPKVHSTLFRYDYRVRRALEAIKERDGVPYHEQIHRAVIRWIAEHDVPAEPDRHAARAARFTRLTEK